MASRTSSFAKTRRDHADETAEDYVETIDDLLAEAGTCRVKDLACKMEVSHVTVTRILSRLEAEGLVIREPYGPIELSAAGHVLARKSRARHLLVLQFLLALGVPEPSAIHDAEGMEHHVSDATLRAMKKFVASH
jgi:DtxR family manganese transport transcriptional regulator